MLKNNALKELRKILYKNDTVEDLKFEVIWNSFDISDRVPMQDVVLIVVDKGVNELGHRFISFLGEMPEGSSFPKNQHSDAFEMFMCIKGLIKETVSSAKMISGKSFNFRPRAHHGFKALTESQFFCVLTEVKKRK